MTTEAKKLEEPKGWLQATVDYIAALEKELKGVKEMYLIKDNAMEAWKDKATALEKENEELRSRIDINEAFNKEITQDFESALDPTPNGSTGSWINRVKSLRDERDYFKKEIEEFNSWVTRLGFGCGNHGCFINPPTGQGTNATCSCRSNIKRMVRYLTDKYK